MAEDLGIFDEMFYGGGQSIPSGKDGAMFFVAPDAVLSSELELVATQPVKLEGDKEERVYLLLTFKGRVNNDKRLGSFTAVMSVVGGLNLSRMLRSQIGKIPLEFRTD